MSTKQPTDDESLNKGSSMRTVSESTSSQSDGKPAFMLTSPILRTPKSLSETDQRLARVSKLDNKLLGNKNIESLTINKLRFNSLGIVGREKESEELNSCFNRMVAKGNNNNNNSAKELVFIKGSSGSGKSKVARTIYDFSTQQRTTVREISKSCIVGEGKFDFNDSDEPFSAVARAFNGLSRTIRKHEASLHDMLQDEDNEKVASLGETLVDELGPTTEVLVRLVPELRELLPSTFKVGTSSDEQQDDSNFDGAKARLNYAFRVLTRVLCKRFHNLVLILDDLQWADVASRKVIDSLISDMQNRNGLMIIGCYRSDEIDENHPLYRHIRGLHAKKGKQSFGITNIDLQPLSLDHVNEMLMRLMAMDENDATEPLAKLCLKRTMGNPHFVIEFLTLLTDENLLVYNLGLLRWTWDESKIEELTMSTENVVELLQSRMKKLSSNERLLLQYAACLGSSFRIDTLVLVWMNHAFKGTRDVVDRLEELIEVLQHGHFIEPDGDSERVYRWVHDSVQEAALSLGRAHEPLSQLEVFQFEVGMILYNELDSQELDEALFDVTDLINRGQGKGQADLATLNLKAAKKARGMSAFSSALTYSSHGIAFLPDDRWAPEHFALTLQLYTLGSQMALATGNFGKLDEYFQEVVSQSGCTLLEKVPVYISQMKKMNANKNYNEAIGVALKLLKELGCNLAPSRALVPLQAIVSLKRTVRQATRISPKEFCEHQPLMENPHQSAITMLLFEIGHSSFFTGDFFLLFLSTTKSVRMTLKHGIHDQSAYFFAKLAAATKFVFGDFASACLLAETSQLLQQRIQNQFYNSAATFEVHNFVLRWKRPLQSCLVPLLENYNRGLRAGNNEFAMWSLFDYHVGIPLEAGKPLGPILARLPEILSQTEEMNLDVQSMFVRSFWQFVCNLIEKSNEPMKLKGDIFNCDEEELDILTSFIAYTYKILLHLIYGDYEGAAEIAMEQGEDLQKTFFGGHNCMSESFHRAVSYYAAYHKTENRKYKREAKRIRKKIHGWKKKNVPNALHFVVFLDAEDAAVEKKYADAENLYKEAVTMAARPGNLLLAALFSERYADFLKRCSDHLVAAEEEIRFRVREAMRYYTEWGAVVKVEMMKKDWVEYCG